MRWDGIQLPIWNGGLRRGRKNIASTIVWNNGLKQSFETGLKQAVCFKGVPNPFKKRRRLIDFLTNLLRYASFTFLRNTMPQSIAPVSAILIMLPHNASPECYPQNAIPIILFPIMLSPMAILPFLRFDMVPQPIILASLLVPICAPNAPWQVWHRKNLKNKGFWDTATNNSL